MLRVQLRVHEGQLNGITDGFDLITESADIGVANIGDLLEDEFLYLRLGDALESHSRAQITQEGIPRPQFRGGECRRDPHDALLIRVSHDKSP